MQRTVRSSVYISIAVPTAAAYVQLLSGVASDYSKNNAVRYSYV
jgi:hypothetical protein